MKSTNSVLDIQNLIKNDLDFLELELKNLFNNKTLLDADLCSFLSSSAKRLRPILGFLFLRAVFSDVNPNQKNVLLAVELIHNATLIHDDVIDESHTRRGQMTINTKFDNNLAVIAGDFLLSIAMEKVLETQSISVVEKFAGALKYACLGEINQYFSKFDVPKLDSYIEKSRQKTAMLFEIGITSGILLSEERNNINLLNSATNFAHNFGIAFQIRDDYLNITSGGSDFETGVYTAPVILAYEKNPNIISSNDILNDLNNIFVLNETKTLIDLYFNKAIDCLDFVNNNEYKFAIINLIDSLRVYNE